MKKKVITVIMATLMLCSSVGEMVYASTEVSNVVEENAVDVNDSETSCNELFDEINSKNSETPLIVEEAVIGVENTELQDCDLVVGENVSTGIEGFVTSLYENILERGIDEVGFADWINKLQNGKVTANQAIYNFFICSEYQNKNKGTDAFVNDLYKGVLGRNPDGDGKRNWVASINNGSYTREDALVGFLNSEEFFNRIQAINQVVSDEQKIFEGYFSTDYDFQMQNEINKFVLRFYRIGLNREPDYEGYYNWTRNIIEKGMTLKDLARGFIFSSEFEGAHAGDSNVKFIEVFYRLLFDRTSDEAGRKSWLNIIGDANPMSKLDELVQSFLSSEEFAEIDRYNSEEGVPTTIVGFVRRLYREILRREPSNTELYDWKNKLKNGDMTANQMAYDFFMSSEYQSKQQSDAAFITDLYVCLWGIEPEIDQVEAWNGSDERNELLGYFLNKEDFFNKVNAYNSVVADSQKVLIGCFFTDADFDAQIQVTKFVTRFYQMGLNREIDYEGGTDWMKKILWQQITPSEFVSGIVYSNEFNDLHSKDSKDDFVEFCYELFFNRPSDADGKANWLRVIGDDNPMDKLKDVVQGFIGSQEFINMCNSFIDA